ncbi:MAG: hypothetical protein ACYCST_10055 [Acidimicrobiales bacterium]
MASYESRRQAADLYRDDRISRNDALRGGLSETECDKIDHPTTTRATYDVWCWSREDGGHWGIATRDVPENVARASVARSEAYGLAATYEPHKA